MVRKQRGVDNASTTLNGAINGSTTTIVVTDASGFPSEGDYYLVVEEEIVLVTNVSGNTLTVVRGQAGSAAAAHASGATIQAILVAEEFTNRAAERGKIKAIPYRIMAEDGSALTASDFTLRNTGSSSLTDLPDGSIGLNCRTHSSDDVTGFTRTFVANTDFRVTAHVQCPFMDRTRGDKISFMQRQSTGGTMSGVELVPKETIGVVGRTTFLAPSGALGSLEDCWGCSGFWARLEVRWNVSASSDEMKWYYSLDGVHWWLSYTDTFPAVSPEVGLWGTNRGLVSGLRFILDAWYEETI